MTILDEAFFKAIQIERPLLTDNAASALDAHIKRFMPLNDLHAYSAYMLQAENKPAYECPCSAGDDLSSPCPA